jgi:predicted dehydrogenase
MRFALLGNHPDGLAMAQALVATGRHTLVVVCDVAVPAFAPQAKSYPDVEEVLADPEVALVIVAGPIGVRGEQLRRAVQSERDVLCVHPCADKPDIAYEAALIQADTKRLLVPLMPDALHPLNARLGELLKDERLGLASGGAPFRVLTLDQTGSVVAGPPWDVLRRIGGEIVEVSGLAATEEIEADKPLTWSGRFERGALIDGRLLPAPDEGLTLKLVGSTGSAEADLSAGVLRWRGGADGGEQKWESVDRWALLAEAVDTALTSPGSAALDWQDEIRALELQDALRRSVEKRRAMSLEYQEVSEEIGNKGTLTLIGCGVIWLILVVMGLSIWWPPIRWAIVPLLGGYLMLLLMNWLARKN